MASYIVRDDRGRTIVDVAPNTLYRFLGECTGFAELRRDDWPDQAAVARPIESGWEVDLVHGDRTLRARTPNTDATLDVLRAWAEEDDWWEEAFTWRPVQEPSEG